MRKFAVLVALFISSMFLVVSVARVSAAPQEITGNLIDLACYKQDKTNTGIQHGAKAVRGGGLICAQACAREGFPVGLLTSDGKVYHVTGNLTADDNAKLVPHMAHTVTISGEVSEEAGQRMIAGSDLKMIGK